MASTIDATLDGDTTADGRVVRKSELEQQFTAAKADIVALQGGEFTPGTGADGAQTVASGDGLIVTRLLIDLTGLTVDNADGDIVGEDDAANCHFGQIDFATMGTLVGGRMTCLEVPDGANITDLDLYSAEEATGTEGSAGEIDGLTETALVTSGGAWTSGRSLGMTALPADDEYLYLTAGTTGGDSTAFTAGKFLLELFGTA